MITVPGYEIKKKVYQGTRIILWQGVRKRDNRPVIIKTLKDEHRTGRKKAWLNHEYDILKKLDIRGVPRPYALEKYVKGMALILENIDGFPLQTLLSPNIPDLKSFLIMAIWLKLSINFTGTISPIKTSGFRLSL